MKNETKDTIFIFAIIMGLAALVWFRTSQYYDQILKGTKYQIHKKDTPKK